ncbi:MAG: GNAT family N-acetyltransferase [Ignavibacteriales bacterium]|nr:GNAT family N-acetyltransferase [Ignavibacteriales bacterium]
MIFFDKILGQQLESAEALNQVEFVRTHNEIFQQSTAAYRSIGSGFAIYAGIDSPLTQSFGLGFNGAVKEQEILELEEFFGERNAPVNIEVSHLADISLTHLLMEREYKILEYSNVLFKQLESSPTPSTKNEIRQAAEHEIDSIATMIATGFLEGKEIPALLLEALKASFLQSNAACFITIRNQELAGGGTVFIQNGIAILGGASTLQQYRNLGIHTELLAHRLNHAYAKQCKLAMVTTLPGSISQRNAEKHGFRLAYARTKFSKQTQLA